MEETKIDRETMGRLAKALTFIGSPDDPVVVALRQAAETGTDRDIKQARTLFLKLRPADRKAALPCACRQRTARSGPRPQADNAMVKALARALNRTPKCSRAFPAADCAPW